MAILALFPKLEAIEQRVSLALYRLLALGAPVSTASVARAAALGSAEAGHILSNLPTVERQGDGRIIGFGGLTVAETRHRLCFDGTEVYAWCAWDTLFLPELLGLTAQVSSVCAATGRDIALWVHADRVECAGAAPWVSFVAPPAGVMDDIKKHFCCQVQFFADQVAGEEWAARNRRSFLATLQQAWQLGRRRNALHYARSQA